MDFKSPAYAIPPPGPGHRNAILSNRVGQQPGKLAGDEVARRPRGLMEGAFAPERRRKQKKLARSFDFRASPLRLSPSVENQLGFVLRRPGVQRRKQLRCGRRWRRLVTQYDISRRQLLAVDSFVCVVVGTDGRSFERNARKRAACPRVAQYFGAQRSISLCGSRTSHRAGRYGGITAQFYLARENTVCSPVVHNEKDKVGGLSANLKAEAASLKCHHRRSAPRTIEI